jgi:hypothetical protein
VVPSEVRVMYPSPNLVVVESPFTLGITTGGSVAKANGHEAMISRMWRHIYMC